MRGGGRKQVSFWADFAGDPEVTVDEAWERFGPSLGAATRDDWNALVARLPAIRAVGRLRVIIGENVFIPAEPVALDDAGVVERRHAVKGWGLHREDVVRFVDFAGVPFVTDLTAPVPGRAKFLVSRIVRDTALARDVKRWHRYRCQICGETIDLGKGAFYAEGHHIQPLGEPHNGPDTAENILCLCPNHHAACDLGALHLDALQLRTAPGHKVGQSFIDYNNRVLNSRRANEHA